MSQFPRMTEAGIQVGPPITPPEPQWHWRVCDDLCPHIGRCEWMMQQALYKNGHEEYLLRCEDRWEWEKFDD